MFRDLVADDGCESSGNPLTNYMSSFIKNTRTQRIADQVRLPNVTDPSSLSPQEYEKIRNRTAVMARQLYPDASEDVLEARMEELMQSLGVDPVSSNIASSSSSSSSAASSSYNTNTNNIINTTTDMMDEDTDDGMSSLYLYNAAYQEYYRHLHDMQLRLEQNQTYTFTEDNPYLSHEDPLSLGMQAYADGQLVTAIQAFEASLQQNPSTEVWVLLGRAAADADLEMKAIMALEQAVESDPGNLDALLALGVSYTNEHVTTRATQCMRLWLERHPVYQDLVSHDDGVDGELPMTESLRQMFDEAAHRNPTDADVHTVLGVLCNVMGDFEGAIEAFERATEHRRDDYSLWNKLGASYANGGQPERAVHAYRQALNLAPSYVRSWVNLGISLAAQGKHQDASVCFLRSLRLNKDAVHTWNYLNISFAALNRKDLMEKTKERDVDLFADEFNV